MDYDILEDLKPKYEGGKMTVTEALLYEILTTLREMKSQEHDYWETWKKKKEQEQ